MGDGGGGNVGDRVGVAAGAPHPVRNMIANITPINFCMNFGLSILYSFLLCLNLANSQCASADGFTPLPLMRTLGGVLRFLGQLVDLHIYLHISGLRVPGFG